MFDIVIRGGMIVDGTGAPAFMADLAIAGDRIAAIGHLTHAETKRVIDASGKVVCPGFVDCHSHSERTILANRGALSSLYQGVTTEVAGNCGMGFAPITPLNRASMEHFVHFFTPDVSVDWSSFGEWLERIGRGIAINLGLQVGHHAVRRAIMGMADRQPTPEEMVAMEDLVAQSLDEGAIGLSFGLEFMPGRVAESEELRRLCAQAAQRHKMTSWHVRNRDRHFQEAVDEAIAVTRAAGAGLQLAHLSAKPGSAPRAWNRVMESVRMARQEGHDVQCDMIPYVAGPGRLSTILPTWASQGTPTEVQLRLRDPLVRERLKAESDRYWLLFFYRQWDRITLTASRAHPEWVGLTFQEIGEQAGRDPFDCVYDILADEGEAMDEVKINGILFSEGDIVEWITDPLFSIASDGYTATLEPEFKRFSNHPNCYGWTPTVIGKYVRDLRAMQLEEAVRKMTSMPAQRFGILERGILRAGSYADIAILAPEAFTTRATYFDPHTYAQGMDCVIVNGAIALDAGVPTGVMAGRLLTG